MTSSSSSLCSTCSIFSLRSYGSRITFRKMGCCTFTNLKGGFQSLDVSITFFNQGFILNEDTHTVRHCDPVDQTGFNFSSQFRLSNIDFSPWAKGAPQRVLEFLPKRVMAHQNRFSSGTSLAAIWDAQKTTYIPLQRQWTPLIQCQLLCRLFY